MGQVFTVAQQKGGSGKTTLSVNLAVELSRRGVSVALLDTDPQGSLGRWFMARRERLAEPGMDLSTASAWGVGYECEKLRKVHDIVIIDTPPKIDADLRPSLREATLVLIPVSSSHVDLWATDGVLDLAARENRPVMIVLTRCKAGTRLGEEGANAAGDLADVASARLGQRVAYAETMGNGLGVAEVGKSAAKLEIAALADEVMARLQS